jgi:hypothetical protein
MTGLKIVGWMCIFAFAPALWADPHPGLFTPVPAPATLPVIEISVGTLAAGQHWAIALEPADNLMGFAVAPGYVVPLVKSKPGKMAPNDIGRLPSSAYILKDSNFSFQNLSTLDKSVFVVVRVPLGRAVSVDSGGKTIFRGNLGGNVLLVDGNISPVASYVEPRAVLMLMNPDMIEDEFGPDVRQDSNGDWVATTGGLRRHLTMLPAINGPFPGQELSYAGGRVAAVFARLHIDENGKVTGVQIVQGAGPLANAVTSTVSEAHFSPFMHDGKPIAVEGVVQYTLQNDGSAPESNILEQ